MTQAAELTRGGDVAPLRLAIVIVNYRTADLTIDAVRSVLPQLEPGDRVYVVEGGSGDDSAAKLTASLTDLPQVEFLPLAENRGFAAGNNAAIRLALARPRPPDLVMLLNPDTIARPGSIGALRDFMAEHPRVGLAGSRQETPDGESLLAARRFHNLANEWDSAICFGPVSKWLRRWGIAEPERDEARAVDWVVGAALTIRREVLETVGLLDEGFFLYFEEVDYCLRAKRAGFDCWYVPQSRIIHLVGQSSGVTSARPGRRPRYWFEARARYWLKNHGRCYKLACDLAWTMGRGLFHLRGWLGRKADPFPPHLWGDFVRYNFGTVDAWKWNRPK